MIRSMARPIPVIAGSGPAPAVDEESAAVIAVAAGG